jgi:hypothetical protein
MHLICVTERWFVSEQLLNATIYNRPVREESDHQVDSVCVYKLHYN